MIYVVYAKDRTLNITRRQTKNNNIFYLYCVGKKPKRKQDKNKPSPNKIQIAGINSAFLSSRKQSVPRESPTRKVPIEPIVA